MEHWASSSERLQCVESSGSHQGRKPHLSIQEKNKQTRSFILKLIIFSEVSMLENGVSWIQKAAHWGHI